MSKTVKFILTFIIILTFSGCTQLPDEATPESLNTTKTGLTITTIYDAKTTNNVLAYGAGLSLLIETPDHTILYDTPQQSSHQLQEENPMFSNMSLLNLKPSDIDIIFISHGHGRSGLESFLEVNSDVTVYSPGEIYVKDLVKDSGAKYDELPRFKEFETNIYSTGSMIGQVYNSFLIEHSLILKTRQGLIIISGCSHSTITEVVKSAKEKLPNEPIYLVYGRLDTSNETNDTNELQVLESLNDLGVQKLIISQCTTDSTFTFGEKYKEIEIINGGSGTVYTIE